MLINLYPQAEEFLVSLMYRTLQDKTTDNNDVHGDAFRINYTATAREDNSLKEAFLEKTRFASFCNAETSFLAKDYTFLFSHEWHL